MPSTATQITKKFTVQRILGACFVLGCLNPWTSFNTNSMDSQPWALAFGSLFLLSIKEIKQPKDYAAITLLTIIGLSWTVLATDTLSTPIFLRAFGSYLSFIICLLAFYNYLIRYQFPELIIGIGGFSWIAFGFIDLFAPEISGLLSPTRTTSDRGVTSLAPEPTFFGVFLFFLSWILLEHSNFRPKGKTKTLLLLNLFAIFFLSKSSMTVLFIFISAMIFASSKLIMTFWSGLRANRGTLYIIFITSVILPLSLYLAVNLLDGSRLAKLALELKERSASSLILSDASINARVASVTMSVYGAVNNLGLPGGLDTFAQFSDSINSSWGYIFWYQGDGDKIMSWLGAWGYEIGIFGVLSVAICAMNSKRGAPTWQIILFILLLFSAIPIAFPLIPMIFSMWMLPDEYATWRSSR